MLIEFSELARYRGKVAMVDGVFDPLHQGHIAYFKAAAALGLPVLCNITCGEYATPKHAVFLEPAERAAVIDALRCIDFTHISHKSTNEVLEELQPCYYVKGSDWQGKLPPEQLSTCERLGIKTAFVEAALNSSSGILNGFLARNSGAFSRQVEQFEGAVYSQQTVPPVHYDKEYFHNNWREGGNDYTLETRRVMEGRNPQLIKEVFAPLKAVDMGCGPGALMQLLLETGVSADGVDYSEHCKSLAPEGVRDRITIGSVTDVALPDRSYDLVICREVLEHLTVLEVRQAIRNICRISSNFVYLTTRYHPAPAHLLDFTTQFEVDPSHITLLCKDFVRALFVLEGFRSRPDLEARMDWLGKGRVIVMQRAAE